MHMKAISTVIGGGAIVAMAALGAAAEHTSSAATVAMPRMTVGATDTQTTPSKAPAVGMARPAIKGPAPFTVENRAAK